MNIVAIILARGGSKGLPNKNILDFCGKPLISWTIENCINGGANSVWVSSDSDEELIPNPKNVGMGLEYLKRSTTLDVDPTNFLRTSTYGLAPQNTTLTVTLRATNPGSSNISVGQLNEATSVLLDFKNRVNLSESVIDGIRASVEVNNESPITGDVSNATSDEIKQRIFDTFPTQNRAVTQADYENLAYRMHAKFGSVKRVSVQRDPDSQKRNLNMFVISEDSFGKLQKTNSTIKRNLKIWLNEYRMINDTIDILDPFILNFGIEYSIKTTPGADKRTIIARCNSALAQKFNNNYYIGESIIISDIYSTLNNVTGVQDVIKARITSRTGTNYSSATIDINNNLSPDGNQLMIPKNAIVEFKFPETDFVGKAK